MLEIPSLKDRGSKNLGAERVLRGRARPSTPTQDPRQSWCSEERAQGGPGGMTSNEGQCPPLSH